jgi:phosphoglucomutase
MDQLKSHTPKEIAGLEVLWARNYDNDTATNMKNKAVVPTGLPKSNVVYYELEGGAWLCVRPSGTEPKIKFYYGVIGKDFDDAQKKSEEFGEAVNKMIEYMM